MPDVSRFFIVLEWCSFWSRCVCDGFSFAWETFGVFDLICAVVAAVLYWHKRSFQKEWETKWEPKVRKYSVAAVGGTLLFSILFIEPFLKYHEAEAARIKATKDIAQSKANKPTPIRDDALRLANRIELFAKEWPLNDPGKWQTLWNEWENYFDGQWIETVRENLYKAGRHSEFFDFVASRDARFNLGP